MMGGRVWVESDEGQGSKFHFTAHFGLSTTPVPRQIPTELAKAQGLAVLIVDDNETNRRILKELINNWGLHATVASGGKEALSLMHQAQQRGVPFSFVLLDHMMPEMDGFMLAEEIRRCPDLVGATLMMLSSADHHEGAERCREMGITAYISKPIKRAELLNAILSSVTGSSVEGGGTLSVGRRVIGSSDRSLRVLLTEDNVVNQKLAVRLLEKRGHSVIVANNGKEALEALHRNEFDVVLMDVQMPEMDGFEATAAIRAEEQKSGRHIPIVAMTAHAMKGDRERCLEVGMDEYISKPLQPGDLFEAVEHLARSPSERKSNRLPAAQHEQADEEDGPAFDKAAALQIVEGDQELLLEIIDIFLNTECPPLMSQIRTAIEQGDAESVHHAAHSLKGAVSNLGASVAVAAALQLESIGRENDLSDAPQSL